MPSRLLNRKLSGLLEMLSGLLIGACGFIFTEMTFPNLLPLAPNLLLMIVLYGFGNVFIFKSLKMIEASKFTIIFSTRTLFTILASTALLGEILNARQWSGALLVMLGVLLVTLKSRRISFTKGELIALPAAIFFGFANANDRFLLQSFDVFPFVFLGYVLPALFILLIYPTSLRKMQILIRGKVLKKMLVLCVIYAASAVIFFTALQIAPTASQVVAVNLTSVIVTVLLAIIFLNEREHIPRTLLGAVISFAGLLLLM